MISHPYAVLVLVSLTHSLRHPTHNAAVGPRKDIHVRIRDNGEFVTNDRLNRMSRKTIGKHVR